MKHVYTSSGIIKNADSPRVGVIGQNSICSDFLDTIVAEGIDLGYELFRADIEVELNSDQSLSEDGREDKLNEALEFYQGDCSTYLYGDWRRDLNGKYSIDKAGRHGYALTYNTDSGNLCVEYSKTTKLCHNTSPCYVMADGSGPCADLDSIGDTVIGYALPDDCLKLNS